MTGFRFPDSDSTRRRQQARFASRVEIQFLSVVFIFIFFFLLHIWVLFHHISHISFLLLFESSVLFVFRIDSLAARETIIPVSFLLVPWSLLLLEPYMHIWIALLRLVLSGAGFSPARTSRR